MNKNNIYTIVTTLFFTLFTEGGHAQGLLSTSGSKIIIFNGSYLVSASGLTNTGVNTALTNNGTLVTTTALQNTSSATLQGNGTYKIGGNWDNSASFISGTSTVEMTGDAAATINAGADPNFINSVIGPNSFYNLILNKGATNPVVSLITNHTKVTQSFTLTGANNKLQLDAKDLMVPFDILGYNSSKYIVSNNTGRLLVGCYTNIPVVAPVGTSASSYTPMTITHQGAVKLLGVRVFNQVLSNATSGSPFLSGVVNKSWELTDPEPTKSNSLTITPQWLNTDELAAFNRAACSIVRWNSTSSTWNSPAAPIGASSGSNPYTRSRSGLTSVGIFAVGSSNAILPLTLVDFTGKIENQNAFLTWETSEEHNMSHFDIEKSLDGKNFQKIGVTKANNTPSVYSTIDAQFFNSSYYRLKINELDGTSHYSKIIFLEKGDKNNLKIIRDTEGSVVIETDDKIELITITNSIGQLIKSTKEKRFLINELNAGIYIVSVKTDKGYLSKKIFKN